MEFEEKILPFLKEHAFAIVFGFIGLLCIGYGLLTLSKPQQADTVDFQTKSDDTVRSVITPVGKQITIDIEGAVQKPGVYSLPPNSRIQDALIAAGGLSQTADRQRVAQTLNLAASLMDGAKLYIPAAGEQYAGSEDVSNSSSGNVQGASSKTVNINQASETELDALPGVGPVTAQKIIAGRPYQSVQELVDKKIIGQSVYSKIKDQVSVY